MSQFKKIGIVGGVSWMSTVEYYNAICQMSHRYSFAQTSSRPPPIPEMTIESLNINYTVNHRGQPGDDKSWLLFESYYRNALKRLEASKVDFAIIASNTPHNRFEQITAGLRIPVLSIFDEVAKVCVGNNIGTVLILGTEPTMSSSVFPSVLEKHGVKGVLPDAGPDRELVTSLIDELHSGTAHNAARRMQTLAAKYMPSVSERPYAVGLSCTELPLAFPDHLHTPVFRVDGIYYLNTTIIHAKAAFDYAISTEVI